MNEQEKRSRARKARRQHRAVTTFCLLTAAIILVSIYIIYRVLSGPGSIGHRSDLTQNPYSPADFATLDGYVTCTAGPTRRGVDVREYQEDVDWEQVRDAGFDFAIIRIGYRGYSVGKIKPDDLAREHLAGAGAAGLDVGVYFYSQAISPEEAAEEARWCLDFLADLEALAEYPFWLAQYKDQMDFPHRVDVWQYTAEGSVPGIEGDVDIDLMFIYE